MLFAAEFSRSRVSVTGRAVVALAAVAIAGCGRGSAPVEDAGSMLRVVGAEDVERLVGEARGRVVLVNVWATWLYRRDGSVAEFWEGGASYETFSGKVRALLDEAARAGGS